MRTFRKRKFSRRRSRKKNPKKAKIGKRDKNNVKLCGNSIDTVEISRKNAA
jgi:hypothetical protein